MRFGIWMEMIGKGKYDICISYVAVRVSDGYVSGHVNQARILEFGDLIGVVMMLIYI